MPIHAAGLVGRYAPQARRAAGAVVLLVLLAGCGGGGDGDSKEPVVAQGNAGQIRKDFTEAVGRVQVGLQGGSVTPAATTSAPGPAATAVSASPAADEHGVDAGTGSATQTGGLAQPADASAAGATPAVPTTDDPISIAFHDAALAAVNQARAQARLCGDRAMPAVGPVRWNARVAYAALLESEWMLERNAFGHAWENGELVWDRLMMAGYLWQAADENIAAGFDTLADAMKAWIDSPAHCVALMRADIEDVGIAVLPGRASSRYSSYWTMALGTLKRVTQ